MKWYWVISIGLLVFVLMFWGWSNHLRVKTQQDQDNAGLGDSSELAPPRIASKPADINDGNSPQVLTMTNGGSFGSIIM